jgi:hypothetical protein
MKTRAALLALLVCGCKPPEQNGLRVVVSYAGPREACLRVSAGPAGKPEQAEAVTFTGLPHLVTKTIGVMSKANAGDAIDVEVSAFEQGCDGGMVWDKKLGAVAKRPASLLEVGVVVRDEDDDTFADRNGSFSEGQLAGTDCDDIRQAIHPGAPEKCNGLDDNCDDVRDEGLPQTFFYRDLDNDGWGNTSVDAGQSACQQPPGYTPDAGDCDDARDDVHPGAAESCNGVDDDCVNGIDVEFHIGMTCDAGNVCSGAFVCGDAGTAICGGPAVPVNWYVDSDGDGHGTTLAGAILACVQPAPARVPNSDDCNDDDRFVHAGAAEICDGIDDDCDPGTVEICQDAGFRGFRQFSSPVNGQWRTLAPFGHGFTWVAGEGNAIALRYFEPPVGVPPPADAGLEDGGVLDSGFYFPGIGDGGFVSYTSRCVGTFTGSWATAAGRVYLGEATHVDRLELDGGCFESWFDVPTGSNVQGLSGLGFSDAGVTLFVAMGNGRVYRVLELGRTDGGGGVSDRSWNLTQGGPTLYAVSAYSPESALVSGIAGNAPFFAHLDGDGGFTSATLPALGLNNVHVLAAKQLGPTLGYLAGGNQTLYSWDGTTFSYLAGPGTAGDAFVGMAAFGKNHLITSSLSQKVFRFLGAPAPDGGVMAELVVDLASAGLQGRTLGATGPDDIWVAGDNGLLFHFGD